MTHNLSFLFFVCLLYKQLFKYFLKSFSFFKNLFILFIYFCLHWVFIAVCGLSLVVASRGCSSLWCAGFSLRWLLLLPSTGSRRTGFSSCGMGAQQLWYTGLVAPQHVGSSRTKARICVPCNGRQILNHCATREALLKYFEAILLHAEKVLIIVSSCIILFINIKRNIISLVHFNVHLEFYSTFLLANFGLGIILIPIYFLYYLFIYLIGCTGSQLQQVGSLVAACRLLSFGT